MAIDDQYLTSAGDPLQAEAEAVAALLQQRVDRTQYGEEQPETDRRRSPDRRRVDRLPLLGQLLLTHGLVSEEELQAALAQQAETRQRLGETVVRLGFVSSVEMARVLAEQLQVPFTDLEVNSPDAMVALMVPEEIARRYQVLAVTEWDDQLVVAMADPRDIFALDDLRMLTGRRIVATLAEREQLAAAIDRIYQHSEVESTLDDAASDYSSEASPENETIEIGESPVVRLVSALLEQAVGDRASDVHVEPLAGIVRVRFRIDGMLVPVSEAPLTVLRPMVSRLKVLGGIDIAQSRIPQDGRFSLKVADRAVDVRVETIPTATGEAVVLRLLDSVRGITKLKDLDLSEDETQRLSPAFHAAQGAVFLTGPTGSGKSSTVYAMLSEINTVDKGIVSVEDPVELRIEGVKQMQINRRAGMTFGNALRAVLRADPDVIFVGEVRDGETARIAAEASITGHLVLSTLHASRAAMAPGRLVDMGVEAYLVASALSCVVAQRLVRRLCERCSREIAPQPGTLQKLGASDKMLAREVLVREPVGCGSCRGTGYKGRIALFEIMPVTEQIARLVVERAPSHDIERCAVSEGMRTLQQAALRRVLDGSLSIAEMIRVVS
jgi:type IV pilus assembly protein PilB